MFFLRHSVYIFYCVLFTANENHASIVLCILYHVSIDDKAKSLFAYTDCIPMVSFSFDLSQSFNQLCC